MKVAFAAFLSFLSVCLQYCSPPAPKEEAATLIDSVSYDSITEYREEDVVVETFPAGEGMIAVRNGNGWGYKDESGKIVIAFRYEGAGIFEGGLAVVKVPHGDWRKSFVYIDKKGDQQGMFFDQKQGSDCKAIQVVVNNLDGERMSMDHLSRCPGGLVSFENQGWEWGSSEFFFPNRTIEEQIDFRRKESDEYTSIFEKFKGESTAFDDGAYKITITVEKNQEGVITRLTVDKSSSTDGGTVDLTLTDGGVMESRSHGS